MELIDVVRKLVGPINPVGESNTDDKRFENLKAMTMLADYLIGDIDKVSVCKGAHEYSIKRAGNFADKFLSDLGIQD